MGSEPGSVAGAQSGWLQANSATDANGDADLGANANAALNGNPRATNSNPTLTAGSTSDEPDRRGHGAGRQEDSSSGERSRGRWIERE